MLNWLLLNDRNNEYSKVGIMKTVTISFVFVLFTVGSLFAQTEISGAVSGEWTAEDSPYIVVDSTWVSVDNSLMLREGVEVRFNEDQGLYVFGDLDAEGTEEDSVYIRVSEGVENWQGIHIIGRETSEWNYSSIICPDSTFVTIRGSSLTFNHCYLSEGVRLFSGSENYGTWNINLTFSHSNVIHSTKFGPEGGTFNASYSRFDFSEVNEVDPGFSGSGTSYIFLKCEVIGELHPSFGNSIVDSCRFLQVRDGEPTGVGIIGASGRITETYIEGNLSIGLSAGNIIPCINNTIHGTLGVGMCNAEVVGCEVDGRLRLSDCEFITMQNSIFANGIYATGVASIVMDSCYFLNGVPGATEIRDVSHMNRVRRIFTRNVFHIEVEIPHIDSVGDGLGDHNTFYSDSAGYNYIHSSQNMIFTNNIFMSAIPAYKLFQQSNLPILENNCIYGFEVAGGPDDDLVLIDEIDSTNIIVDPLIEWDGIIPNLSSDSPCIDRGASNFNRDPDGTRTDIGAVYFNQRQSVPDHGSLLPNELQLHSPFPNPFNSTTTINYSLPTPQRVIVSIFDISGRLIETLYNDYQTVGNHSLLWNIQNFDSGVYVLRVQTDREVKVTKLVAMK